MIDRNDARIDKAESVFDAVVILPPEERDSALDEHCGEDRELRAFVERLLRIDDSTTDDLGQQMPFQPACAGQTLVNTRIGRYRLKRVIASGGMGTVYEAMQEKPHRTVAVKVMKRGIPSRSALRRFEYESQILARLRHPGIAQVYEAGVHEDETGSAGLPGEHPGVPYFVMEYIPGAKSITHYARKKKLTTRQRLELFIKVCEAVHHGHQKGIIHRDLKPGNILVDSGGQVKVIDFGVARATDSDMAVTTLQTDVGQLIGTLQYMSPEQCDADPHDLDTRSDVYALGVVLYELLTEQLPYDVSEARIFEATRLIREQSPARPSTINRALRGDLETITLKALEKDRDRRYQSALDLAEDIRRYLTHRPIAARPPSVMYQFRTFARRNKALVGGTAATFIALVAGLIGVSAMYVQAERLRAESEQRTRETDKIAQFQAAMLTGLDPELMGTRLRGDVLHEAQHAWRRAGLHEEAIEERSQQLDRLVAGTNFTNAAVRSIDRNILAESLEAIAHEFDDVPLVQATLLQTVASTYRELGLLGAAMPPQEQALAIRRRVLGDAHPDTVESIRKMGLLLQAQGRFVEAETHLREALEVRRLTLGSEHPDTLDLIDDVCGVLWSQGRSADAAPYCRQALDGRRRVLGNQHLDTLNSISAMAQLLQSQEQFADAEAYVREAVAGYRLAVADENADHLHTLHTLGFLLRQQGSFTEAVVYLREAVELSRRMYGDLHPRTLQAINNMGGLLVLEGNIAEAESWFREAMEGSRLVRGNEHLYTLLPMNHLGHVLRELGRLEEADRLGAEAVQGARLALAPEHWNTGVFLFQHGLTLAAKQRFEEAEERMVEAHAIFASSLGEQHERTVEVIHNLADFYNAWHEAEPHAGHDARAAEWRARLPAETTSRSE